MSFLNNLTGAYFEDFIAFDGSDKSSKFTPGAKNITIDFAIQSSAGKAKPGL